MGHDENEPTEKRGEPSRLRARRELLGSGGVAAAGLLLSAVAAACGDDDGGDQPPSRNAGGAGKAGSGRGTAGTMAGRAGSGGVGTASRDRAGSSGAGRGPAAGSDAGPDAGPDGGKPAPDADIEPLNLLLAAEYNAITAYGAGGELIANAGAGDPLYALRTVIVDIAVDFRAQHELHAEALVEAIESLGGTPVDEAEIAEAFEAPQRLLANPTITNVLKFAASAERAAAVAYNQVLAGLEAAKFRYLASAIEGDESQHFIVLAALVLGLAQPGPKLSSDTADGVVPEAFVHSVGDRDGLEISPPNYFD